MACGADLANRFVAKTPILDITGDPLNQHGSGGGSMSLREVLVGMIREYARHMGHRRRARRVRQRPAPHRALWTCGAPVVLGCFAIVRAVARVAGVVSVG